MTSEPRNDERQLRERVRGLGSTIAEILADAAKAGRSPFQASKRRVERVLDRARRRGQSRPAATDSHSA